MSGARRQRALSRRYFVQGAGAVGLGLLVGCGRWPGQAQPAARGYRLAWLAFSSPSPSGTSPQYDALLDGLRDLGYLEGHVSVQPPRGRRVA